MSDSQTQIYFDLVPEYLQLLNDNDLSIQDILRQQNIEAEVIYGISPEEIEKGIRSKDPVMIVLASTAAVLAIGTAISKVLHTLQRRPLLVEYYHLVELRDAKGNILMDNEGKPLLKRQKKYELIEPRKEDSSLSLEVGMTQSKGLVIKFCSTDKQIGTQEKPKSF